MPVKDLDEALERCRRRRIAAWDDLEEYERSKVISPQGVDLSSMLIERAKADIELFDFLIARLEAAAVEQHPSPTQ